MFKILKKEKTLNSPVRGKVISLDKVSDEVFSKKILGEGFAVIPAETDFVSPASGTVGDVSETLHAYCITSDDGLELIVHIGIDTVGLKGAGFTPQVKTGDKVSCGSPLAAVDITKLKSLGYDTSCIVVITNSDKLKNYSVIEADNAEPGAPAFKYII